MGIFRQFPYSNFHDINLDNILKIINDLRAEWANFIVDWGEEVSEQVDKWLEDHPEATTTVEDHSISQIKLTEELANKTIKDYYTPQMFGAKADGITDDTAAFVALSTHSPTAIPKGNYVLNDRVILDNVLFDFGHYNNQAPLYKKEVPININNATYSAKTLILPFTSGYGEAAAYLKGYYFIAARNLTTETGVIAKYDEDYNFISSINLNPNYGIPHSMYTDGEFLYVDTYPKYSLKIDPELQNVIATNIPGRVCTIPYNNNWYGLDYDNQGFIVSVLSSYAGSILEQHKIYAEVGVWQSATIINGILYIPTINGDFNFIDIATWTLLEPASFVTNQEIESFFADKNNEVKAMGHYYGFGCQEHIISFNGIDYPLFKYIPVDGSVGAYALTVIDRQGVYNITNGLAGGFPFDNMDLISLDHGWFAVSRADNRIAFYTGSSWQIIGTPAADETNITITMGNATMTAQVQYLNGDAYIRLDGYGPVFGSGIVAGMSIGTLPEKFRPKHNVPIVVSLRNAAVADNAVYDVGSITIESNGDIKIYANNTTLANARGIVFGGTIPLK